MQPANIRKMSRPAKKQAAQKNQARRKLIFEEQATDHGSQGGLHRLNENQSTASMNTKTASEASKAEMSSRRSLQIIPNTRPDH